MEPISRSLYERHLPPDLSGPCEEVVLWLVLLRILGSPLGEEASRLAGEWGAVLLPLEQLPRVNLQAARRLLLPSHVYVRRDLVGRWCLAVCRRPLPESVALEFAPVRHGREDDGGLWVGIRRAW